MRSRFEASKNHRAAAARWFASLTKPRAATAGVFSSLTNDRAAPARPLVRPKKCPTAAARQNFAPKMGAARLIKGSGAPAASSTKAVGGNFEAAASPAKPARSAGRSKGKRFVPAWRQKASEDAWEGFLVLEKMSPGRRGSDAAVLLREISTRNVPQEFRSSNLLPRRRHKRDLQDAIDHRKAFARSGSYPKVPWCSCLEVT